MVRVLRSPLLSWTVITPLVAIVMLAVTWGRDLGTVLVAVVAVILASAVLAAVHHAEVVALRVGEPSGSLVLAVALTVVASVLTVVPGQATRLQGGVHLVVLAAFLFLAINP
jgi:Ca2+:H+ antiporter